VDGEFEPAIVDVDAIGHLHTIGGRVVETEQHAGQKPFRE